MEATLALVVDELKEVDVVAKAKVVGVVVSEGDSLGS